MRKIPTLFVRDPVTHKVDLDQVTAGCEWVIDGEGIATRKWDGTCAMIDKDGIWMRREVKPGKKPPPNFRPIETDPNTGKTVGWEPAEQSGFFKYLDEAARYPDAWGQGYGTYELVGPKINGNPEGFDRHYLIRHAVDRLSTGGSVEGQMNHARSHGWEGIVWHHADGRMAKLKVRDL